MNPIKDMRVDRMIIIGHWLTSGALSAQSAACMIERESRLVDPGGNSGRPWRGGPGGRECVKVLIRCHSSRLGEKILSVKKSGLMKNGRAGMGLAWSACAR